MVGARVAKRDPHEFDKPRTFVNTPESGLAIPATFQLFGHPDSPVVLTVLPRSTRWRAVRAARAGAAGYSLMLLTPLPPHLGWFLGGLGAGTFFGLRRWRERFTIIEIEGECPRCRVRLELPGTTRLQDRITLTCDACGQTGVLHAESPVG